MERRTASPIALSISSGTAVAVLILAVPTLRVHGSEWFFREGDSYLFRAIARDPFGTGKSFAVVGRMSEVPYRYGRVGLPLLSWLLALGRPGLVGWWLIAINLASIAAIPGLAALLLGEYGAPPLAGALVLLSPGLLLIRDYVFTEPLLIALVLLAYVLDARGRSRSALVVLAYAVLVKEVAAIVLLPWMWRAVKRRDLREAAECAAAVLPYVAWAVCVRIRMGQFPFFAHQRSQALTWPGGGIRQVIVLGTPDHVVVAWWVVATVAFCAAGAFATRRLSLGVLTAALAVYTACFGENALRYESETLRLLTLPQVFAVLCCVVAISARQRSMPSNGARN